MALQHCMDTFMSVAKLQCARMHISHTHRLWMRASSQVPESVSVIHCSQPPPLLPHHLMCPQASSASVRITLRPNRVSARPFSDATMHVCRCLQASHPIRLPTCHQTAAITRCEVQTDDARRYRASRLAHSLRRLSLHAPVSKGRHLCPMRASVLRKGSTSSAGRWMRRLMSQSVTHLLHRILPRYRVLWYTGVLHRVSARPVKEHNTHILSRPSLVVTQRRRHLLVGGVK